MMKVESNRPNEAAFQVVYNAGNHMHVGDGQNTAATGHMHPLAVPARMGDGWVWNDATAELSSFLEIEKRLAETIFRQDANQKIIEGDITWFTHMSTMNNMASLIVWNYKTNKAMAPNFNYRPVMVHEIGHLLGLDHCTAADNCEVMQSMIGPGADPQIKAGEITALEFLYGPGGPCARRCRLRPVMDCRRTLPSRPTRWHPMHRCSTRRDPAHRSDAARKRRRRGSASDGSPPSHARTARRDPGRTEGAARRGRCASPRRASAVVSPVTFDCPMRPRGREQ